MDPAGLSATLAAAVLSATLATGPAPSATTAMSGWAERLGSKFQVNRLTIKGSQEAALTLPDGSGRVVIETQIGSSTVRMGGHYNFVNGKIQAWIGYALSLWKDGPTLQLAGSDDIGLGRLYLTGRYLERARSVPVGLGWRMLGGSMLLSAERTTWRLAPFDNPAAADVGIIDAWGATLTSSGLIPDVVQVTRQEQTRQDQTVLRYRRAFRGFGGDWHFDRADADVRIWTRGVRRADDVLVRGFWGQAWNMSPALPLRETYGLGGANALRGYKFEEFRGTGVLVFGTEYALRTPWKVTARRLGLDLHRADLVVFAEGGRIQDDWTRGPTPLKWSGGGGVKFTGRMLRTHKSVFRLLVARALADGKRAPVYYALADVI